MLLWYPEISSSAALLRMILDYLSGDVTTADWDSCLKVRALRKQANTNLIGSGMDLHCTFTLFIRLNQGCLAFPAFRIDLFLKIRS